MLLVTGSSHFFPPRGLGCLLAEKQKRGFKGYVGRLWGGWAVGLSRRRPRSERAWNSLSVI